MVGVTKRRQFSKQFRGRVMCARETAPENAIIELPRDHTHCPKKRRKELGETKGKGREEQHVCAQEGKKY